MSGREVWAVVVLAVASLAAVTAVTLAGASAADILAVVATVIVPTTSILLVGRQLANRVGRVEEQVNGRMTELIAKVPDSGDREG